MAGKQANIGNAKHISFRNHTYARLATGLRVTTHLNAVIVSQALIRVIDTEVCIGELRAFLIWKWVDKLYDNIGMSSSIAHLCSTKS